MRKSKIYFALEKALLPYYTNGFTATADKCRKEFKKELNKLYKVKRKKK